MAARLCQCRVVALVESIDSVGLKEMKKFFREEIEVDQLKVIVAVGKKGPAMMVGDDSDCT